MIIGVLRESKPGETRVAATPATVAQLLKLGYEVVVESGAGDRCGLPGRGVRRGRRDDRRPVAGRRRVRVNAPSEDELARLQARRDADRAAGARAEPGPGRGPGRAGRSRRWRWTRCRGSPGRSRWTCCRSMANIAGLPRGGRGGARVRPVLHRPGDRGGQGAAGEGAGGRCRCRRAGRDRRGGQSLGAIVRATDPRPEVADQVQSLGGEYLSVEAADVEVSATGYAKEMARGLQGARAAELYAEQAARRRHHHHHRADPGPAGAAADHRRDGGRR